MTDQDVINYFSTKSNTEVVESTMNIVNGFIDIRSESDRNQIKTDLANEGVDIAASICTRDE